MCALLLVAPVLALAPTAPATPGLDPRIVELLRADAPAIPVLVRFASPPGDADVRDLLRAGFAPGILRYEIVPVLFATGPASAVRTILTHPRVAYVELDVEHSFLLDRAAIAARAKPVWDARYQDALGTHEGGFTGRGVTIAVVDTGVDATHPDLLWEPLADAQNLPAKTMRNFKMLGRDATSLHELAGASDLIEANTLAIDMANTDTTGGHGTHVAGTVAGSGAAGGGLYRGAAPGAQLVGFGAGETLVVHLGLAAFDYIHQHHAELGIRIVQNSWGSAGDWDPESAVTLAARRLVNEDGLVVVFAAGNDGGDGSTIQTSTWSNIPEVVSVANYDDRSGWLRETSSRGQRDLERTWPDVAAPGTQIISTAAVAGPVTYDGTLQDAAQRDGGEPAVVPAPVAPTQVEAGGERAIVGYYASSTGTSMAAPLVSGIVALLLEANPALTPADVRTILRATANMPPGRTYAADGFGIGNGVADAGEAVAVALRMRDGATLAQALRTAYVDYGSSPAEIDLAPQRRLAVASPVEGALVSGSTLTVSGAFVAGGVTDDSLPLSPTQVEKAPPPRPPAPEEIVFREGFEEGMGNWSVEQDGFGPGLLTDWRLVNEDAMLTWAGAHGGSDFFWVGAWQTSPQVTGTIYTDLADATLISPPIDLRDASSASLAYWRAGLSETEIDVLRVYADAGVGAPVLIDEISGDLFGGESTGTWEESVIALDAFVGKVVRLRFRFTSNEVSQSPNLAGWSIDDMRVLATSGGGGPTVVATMEAATDFGVGSLTTTFTFGASGNVPALRYEIDFGDGSPIHVASSPGSVAHTYGPGQFRAGVRAIAANATDEASVAIDVAPTGVVQARAPGGLWVSAGAGGAEDAPFEATIDLIGLLPGPATIELRHYGADLAGIMAAVDVVIA